MSVFSTCCTSFTAMSKAAAKAAKASMRRARLLGEAVDWPARAAVCERCPLRVVENGVSYCGQPFLTKIHRDPVTDGCGCPTRAKAKDPAEHCPLTVSHEPSRPNVQPCNCKWCRTLHA